MSIGMNILETETSGRKLRRNETLGDLGGDEKGSIFILIMWRCRFYSNSSKT